MTGCDVQAGMTGETDGMMGYDVGTSKREKVGSWGRVSEREDGRTGGRLEAIWIKRMKRGPMASVRQATVQADHGLLGNANQGGRRQITILEREVWKALMREVHGSLPPSARRANLLISGLSLSHSRKRILRVGRCRIRIVGETKPCERMEEACPGLQAAMSRPWAGGAFGEILDDGEIVVGAPLHWVEE